MWLLCVVFAKFEAKNIEKNSKYVKSSNVRRDREEYTCHHRFNFFLAFYCIYENSQQNSLLFFTNYLLVGENELLI